MDGLQSMFVEKRLLCTCQFEAMNYIVFGFFESKAWHVITHGNSLVKGFHDGKLHDPLQIGLTGEDQDEGVVGVHLEVGEEPQFFQGAGLKKMGLVDDEKDALSRTLLGFQKGLLDLAIDSALGESLGEAEQTI
jgi:hypothetical protein